MRLLRMVLEGVNDPSIDEKTVVMDGPLSEVYTQALAVAYAKADPIEDQSQPAVAVESQVNDALMQEAIIKTLTKDAVTDASKPGTTIYGVSQTQIQPQDIINVVTSISQEKTPDNYILVIDATKTANNPDQPLTHIMHDINNDAVQKNLATAIESLALAFGARVAHSLEEAIKLL